ncbi:RtcB family protein [Cystobacter fuscus]
MEGEALRQLEAAARLPGMRSAVGLPDLHPGKGAPVGAAFTSQGVFYPFLVGNDIGCGMGLWALDLPARKAKPERWAARLDLEGPWEGDAEAMLAEAGVRPCGFEARSAPWAVATTSPRCSGWRRCTTHGPSRR